MVHRRRFFDLGHQRRPAPRKLPGLLHVIRSLHEGERQPVDSQFAGKFQILAILVGKCGDRDDDVGNVDSLPVRNRSADLDGAFGKVAAAPYDLKVNDAVIHQQLRSGLQDTEHLLMGKLDPVLPAGGRIKVEGEARIPSQPDGLAAKGSAAVFRTLQVSQDPDRASRLGRDFPYETVAVPGVVVRAMAHVETEYVRAGQKELSDRVLVR